LCAQNQQQAAMMQAQQQAQDPLVQMQQQELMLRQKELELEEHRSIVLDATAMADKQELEARARQGRPCSFAL
jgi:alkylation response protein AidB-like acyl-CoA dehydrogenase